MISVDRQTYNVKIISPSDIDFELVEGKNAGMSLAFRSIRDIGGTAYTYSMEIEPDPEYPDDFDALFTVISAPVDTHIVSFPLGQTTIEFEAMISGGGMKYLGQINGRHVYSGLSLKFTPIEPQIAAE